MFLGWRSDEMMERDTVHTHIIAISTRLDSMSREVYQLCPHCHFLTKRSHIYIHQSARTLWPLTSSASKSCSFSYNTMFCFRQLCIHYKCYWGIGTCLKVVCTFTPPYMVVLGRGSSIREPRVGFKWGGESWANQLKDLQIFHEWGPLSAWAQVPQNIKRAVVHFCSFAPSSAPPQVQQAATQRRAPASISWIQAYPKILRSCDSCAGLCLFKDVCLFLFLLNIF